VTAERDRAREERNRAERVIEAMTALLQSTTPEKTPGGDVLRVTDFFDRGESSVELLGEEPEVQRRMFEVLATLQAERGLLPAALRNLERALELPADEATRLRLEHQRAVLTLHHQGPPAARPLLQASLDQHRRMYGDMHLDVAQAMQDLAQSLADADERQELMVQVQDIRRRLLPADDPAQAAILNDMGVRALQGGALLEAVSLFEQSLEILERRSDVPEGNLLIVRHNLASAVSRSGDSHRALPLQRDVLEARRRLYGDSTAVVASSWEALGVTLAQLGHYEESTGAFAAALGIFEHNLDPSHWRIANGLRNVAEIRSLQGRPLESLGFMDRAIALAEANGDSERGLAGMRGQRAMILLGLGREGAFEELEAAAETLRRLPGYGEDAYVSDVEVWTGIALLEAGEPEGAEGHFRRGLEIREALLPPSHPALAEARVGLAVALASRGEIRPAEPLLREAFPAYQEWGLTNALLKKRAQAIWDVRFSN
jgi:tetratricopeptide (TPR) repeat protein